MTTAELIAVLATYPSDTNVGKYKVVWDDFEHEAVWEWWDRWSFEYHPHVKQLELKVKA